MDNTFECFKNELEALCRKYGVVLVHGRDFIELWNKDVSTCQTSIEDHTRLQNET